MTIKRQICTPEIKERAVRMLIEASGDYSSTLSAIISHSVKDWLYA